MMNNLSMTTDTSWLLEQREINKLQGQAFLIVLAKRLH